MAFMLIMEGKGELTTRLTNGFRCHPNYGNDLRRQYNQILSDIAKSNLLSFILSQVLGQEFTAGKLDNDMWKDVLHAEYALS
ncbi:hypothetical protein [Salmonella enterica]|uniref:hypothetical protein n=1 Tax=Salmonella enterica TaxID=28901 RepID=UPI0022390E31|nr:hypothetical protein [Salmonella enterica]MCW6831719.1 hypothetical protein [Salmonella enterica]